MRRPTIADVLFRFDPKTLKSGSLFVSNRQTSNMRCLLAERKKAAEMHGIWPDAVE
jgi:hypothetical protein